MPTKRKEHHERKRPARDGEGKPAHVPTSTGRDMVKVMVAGGIAQSDIAQSLSINLNTLHKHYRQELDAGATALNTVVLIEIVKRIKAGEFAAMKWWTQSRMGWSERIVVDDGKPADTPVRVIVEFLGDAAVPRIEHSAPRAGSRLTDDTRKTVHLVG